MLITQKNEDVTQETTEIETYQLNIWNITLLNNLPKFTAVKKDFQKNLVKILIDTRAKMSVCYKQQAKLWGIYDKMKPSFAEIHPHNSAPIKSVSFKNQPVSAKF